MLQSPHQEFLMAYQSIHPSFVRYCRGTAYGIMETEDLVNETVLTTIEHYDSIRNKDRLLSYMISVANNIARNKRRRLKFKGEYDEQSFQRLEAKCTSPETAMDIHLLYKALGKLPEKQKEALVLFEISGFSIKEVSKIQNASISAVKTRLSRGRQKLKALLEEKEQTRSIHKQMHFLFTLMM